MLTWCQWRSKREARAPGRISNTPLHAFKFLKRIFKQKFRPKYA